MEADALGVPPASSLLCACSAAAALAAALARRFCFFRFTGWAGPDPEGAGLAAAWAFGADAAVGEGRVESLGVLGFGTVMNLEPSLFVYFAVPLEAGEEEAVLDAGGGGGGLRFPFIFGRGLRRADC